jgi:hypothetical protein
MDELYTLNSEHQDTTLMNEPFPTISAVRTYSHDAYQLTADGTSILEALGCCMRPSEYPFHFSLSIRYPLNQYTKADYSFIIVLADHANFGGFKIGESSLLLRCLGGLASQCQSIHGLVKKHPKNFSDEWISIKELTICEKLVCGIAYASCYTIIPSDWNTSELLATYLQDFTESLREERINSIKTVIPFASNTLEASQYELRLIALAIALIRLPRFLLLDRFFEGLSADESRKIVEMLRDYTAIRCKDNNPIFTLSNINADTINFVPFLNIMNFSICRSK